MLKERKTIPQLLPQYLCLPLWAWLDRVLPYAEKPPQISKKLQNIIDRPVG